MWWQCGLLSDHVEHFFFQLMMFKVRDSVDNTVEENSSVFSLSKMCWLPSARACEQ